MTIYDVFNGDADGICALHQFRLANPADSILITGVKRDIQLLKQIQGEAGDVINVFDISFDKNRDAVEALLNSNANIQYFDHHYAGDIPQVEGLKTYIDTSPETCTSVIVDQYLQGHQRHWAVVGAFGDGFDDLAKSMGHGLSLSAAQIAMYKTLGILLNYNGYGSTLEDLHFPPATLYKQVSQFKEPEDFMTSEAFLQLESGYNEDIQHAQALVADFETDKQALFILPNEKWARRISGVYANELNKRYPNRAHALLTDLGDNNYLVSVRAPAATKTGADELCRQFETGGGRQAAAGINRLPASDYDLFLQKFTAQFA